MPPKRSSSSGKSSSKASAKPAAKSKAASKGAASSKDSIEKEAKERFENLQPDGNLDGTITLKEFADCIREMNRRKCMLWGQEEECGPIVKQEWMKLNGFQKREIRFADFKAWWPSFLELVETRQDEKEKAKAVESEKAAKAEQALAACCSGDGVWQVPMKSLQIALDKARQKGKTPLILDNTEHHVSEQFFAYSGAYIIECKKMIMESCGASKRPVEEILEDERERFFRGKCFKMGQTVVFRMANTACDLKGTFSSTIFPAMALLDVSELNKVLGPANVGNIETSPFIAMCPDNDERLELSANGIHEKFSCVMISHFNVEDYVEFLEAMVPLDMMQPISPIVE
eukprot:gnl/MRDRNA2_/MRDRNA2_77475_c0_seq3.p1 gnl/MRDRNA2_/MRDRNA2_77475_c0~~gnl/MRDRNA2_/MRDRNA2_77475_c0_seq3.p1  ORF type:complete len:373 (-),score=91.08 gnl/MRDRNA2_/MRDRNA2_77475_c0_seq3:166-1197(-)